jgi:hypothetical protein
MRGLLLHLVVPLVGEVPQLRQPAPDVVPCYQVLELAPPVHLQRPGKLRSRMLQR